MPPLVANRRLAKAAAAELAVVPLASQTLLGLDLDPDRPGRAGRVTTLLRCGLRDPDGREPPWRRVHRASLKQRLQWLLALCRRTGLGQLSLRCRCPHCAAELELAMALPADQADAAPATVDCEPAPGVRLRLRLPTGEDQSRWASRNSTDAAAMARDLVIAVDAGGPGAEGGDRLDPAWLSAIGESLEAADPLTALELHSGCPDCGAALALPVDLERLLLQWLGSRQSGLLFDVHRLASAYHWGEREIAALDPRRRAFYLGCLEREGR